MKLSRDAKRLLRTATKQDRITPGQRARALLLAEAIRRVDDASDSVDPSQVVIKRLDTAELQEAIGLLETGGLYAALAQSVSVDTDAARRLEDIADTLADACEAVSCNVQSVCRDRRGRYAPQVCEIAAPERWYLESGAVVWRGADTRIAVQTASGVSELRACYALVPIDAVLPSHDPLRSWQWTPGYPRELQERDYQTETERTKVVRAADKRQFDPRLLIADNIDALTGPPVISTEGYVLGGNGRTMIAQLHMAKYGAEKYEEALEAELSCSQCYGLGGGPTVGVMLVRVLLGEYDRKSVSALLNESLTATKGRAAAAVSVGGQLPDSMLDRIADQLSVDETFASAVRSLGPWLVQRLREAGIITPSNQLRWVKSNRGDVRAALSRNGKAQLQEALVGALIRDAEALRDASDSLYNWYTYLAPAALVLHRWARAFPAGADQHRYDWTTALRQVAAELAIASDLPKREVISRYATSSLFDEDEPIDSFRSWRDAIVFRWALDAKRRPAATARAAIAYWRAIPPEIKGRTRPLMPRTAEQLADEGVDADSLMHSVMGMDTLEQAKSYGSIRGYLIGKVDKAALARLELDDEDDEDDLSNIERMAVDVDDLQEQFVEAARAFRSSGSQADADELIDVARELRTAGELTAQNARWLRALDVQLDRVKSGAPTQQQILVVAHRTREPVQLWPGHVGYVWVDGNERARMGLGADSDPVYTPSGIDDAIAEAIELGPQEWFRESVRIRPPTVQEVRALRWELRDAGTVKAETMADGTRGARVTVDDPDTWAEVWQLGWHSPKLEVAIAEDATDELDDVLYGLQIASVERRERDVETPPRPEADFGVDDEDEDEDEYALLMRLGAEEMDDEALLEGVESLVGDWRVKRIKALAREFGAEKFGRGRASALQALADAVRDKAGAPPTDEPEDDDDEPEDDDSLLVDEEVWHPKGQWTADNLDEWVPPWTLDDDEDEPEDDEDEPEDDDEPEYELEEPQTAEEIRARLRGMDLLASATDLYGRPYEMSATEKAKRRALEDELARLEGRASGGATSSAPTRPASQGTFKLRSVRGIGAELADRITQAVPSDAELAWWTDPANELRFNNRTQAAPSVLRRMVSGLGAARVKRLHAALSEAGIVGVEPDRLPTNTQDLRP